MFIGRAELLPEDETVREHQKAKEEEAVLLAADRAGPGLFKGAFWGMEPHMSRARDWRGGILDPEDNVVRCPDCHWELEDGGCNRCGFHEFDMSGSGSVSEDDDFDDSSIDTEDEIDDDFAATMNAWTAENPRPGDDPTPRVHFSSDDDDEDDDEDDDMDGFIDNEALDDDSSDADTESTMTMYNRQFGQNEDHHLSSSSQPSTHEDAVPHFEIPALDRYESPPTDTTTNEDQSDAATNYDEITDESDTGNATPTQPGRSSRPMRVILSSDDEDEEDHTETTGHCTTHHDGEDDDDDDEEQPGELSTTEPSIDDSEDAESDEDSEDDVRPPQSYAQRRQHLTTQRARRSNYNPHLGSRGRANPPYNPPTPQQYPTRQQNQRGRGATHRYQPYQRPYGRRIPVGGDRGYSGV